MEERVIAAIQGMRDVDRLIITRPAAEFTLPDVGIGPV
jgi:hypothetical protein